MQGRGHAFDLDRVLSIKSEIFRVKRSMLNCIVRESVAVAIAMPTAINTRADADLLQQERRGMQKGREISMQNAGLPMAACN